MRTLKRLTRTFPLKKKRAAGAAGLIIIKNKAPCDNAGRFVFSGCGLNGFIIYSEFASNTPARAGVRP
jgi:hypothetical protein